MTSRRVVRPVKKRERKCQRSRDSIEISVGAMDAGPAEMVVPSESGGQGEVESTRQRGAMSRAAVHSARCLTSCQWMFTVACTAIAQKKRWGVDAMRELLAQDLAFAGECPEQGYGLVILCMDSCRESFLIEDVVRNNQHVCYACFAG